MGLIKIILIISFVPLMLFNIDQWMLFKCKNTVIPWYLQGIYSSTTTLPFPQDTKILRCQVPFTQCIVVAYNPHSSSHIQPHFVWLYFWMLHCFQIEGLWQPLDVRWWLAFFSNKVSLIKVCAFFRHGDGLVTQSCPTLCDCMDYSPPGSSVFGIFQARTLEWAAISFSRVSSQARDRIQVSCIIGRFFTN